MTKKLTAFVSAAALGVFLTSPVFAQETSGTTPSSSDIFSQPQADQSRSAVQAEPTPPTQPQPMDANQSNDWSGDTNQTDGATNNGNTMSQMQPAQSSWTSSRVYMLRYDADGREFICVCGQRVYFDDSPAPNQGQPDANQLAPTADEAAESMNEVEEAMEEEGQQGAVAPADPADTGDADEVGDSVETAVDDSVTETEIESVPEDATDEVETVVDDANEQIEDTVESDSLPPLE